MSYHARARVNVGPLGFKIISARKVITPNDSGRPKRSGFCGKKSEAIPQKLRSVERSTIAKAIGADRDCYVHTLYASRYLMLIVRDDCQHHHNCL